MPYDAGNPAEWQRFLSHANNATLFHDLAFLAYHPERRFRTHHLAFRLDGKTVALLPAAIVTESDGRLCLRSPYGASVGGLVWSNGISAQRGLDVAKALIHHCRTSGIDAVEMRLGPNVYLREPDDLQEFCLHAAGFRPTRRWLTHIVDLSNATPGAIESVLSKSKRYDVRHALTEGVCVREANADHLGEFYSLLQMTCARHDAQPTHTLDELDYLLRNLPDRVRLFLCSRGGIEIAGVLVFMLNARVAYSFYICSDDEHQQFCGSAATIARVMDVLATEGVSYLELGPSSFDDGSLNAGVAFFKEGMSARGFGRTTWRWERPQTPRGPASPSWPSGWKYTR